MKKMYMWWQIMAKALFCVGIVCATVASNADTKHRSTTSQPPIDMQKYQREIEGSVQLCQTALATWQAQTKDRPKKPIAVFDIDETLLSNRKLMEKYDYQLTVEQFHAEVGNSKPTLISESRELLETMRSAGLGIVLITGRKQGVCQQTVQQLKANGIPQEAYLAIYCHNDLNKPAHYKESVRQELTKAGYTIVFSVSDQMGDLTGADVGIACQLPNPFYRVA
ncbi:MAG: hypothetical protein CMF52_04095 [Legionellales bacterium]|nr:hypothetical protein [Legionellales bacterium]